jgi:hypothetical protein
LPARFWGKRIASKTLSFGPIWQTPEFKEGLFQAHIGWLLFKLKTRPRQEVIQLTFFEEMSQREISAAP